MLRAFFLTSETQRLAAAATSISRRLSCWTGGLSGWSAIWGDAGACTLIAVGSQGSAAGAQTSDVRSDRSL